MLFLMQFQMTDAEIDHVNANQDNLQDYYKAKLDSLMGRPAAGLALGRYKGVATIDTDDKEHAFSVMNGVGDDSIVTRYLPTMSMSVGDILVTDNGDAFICAAFGFEPTTLATS